LSALERELHGPSQRDTSNQPRSVDDDEYDEYGKWASGER
jgi:hypothetical protein